MYNYLEANSKVPWEDLRFLFGEIMYGGHITDDWDRRLCISYLEEYMQPELVNTNLFSKLKTIYVVRNYVFIWKAIRIKLEHNGIVNGYFKG